MLSSAVGYLWLVDQPLRNGPRPEASLRTCLASIHSGLVQPETPSVLPGG